MSSPAIVLLMGPTASGKSELAVAMAQHLNGEIISVDSSLVYRGMDIGTAKPDRTIRAAVPHHLIDLLDPAERFSAGQFREQALTLIAKIQQQGRLPILAGGTMMYFHALMHGLAPLPAADFRVRIALDLEASQKGWPAMHERLRQVDPQTADRIHPNDSQRIQRALEVYQLTGQPLSAFFEGNPGASLNPLTLIVSPGERSRLHRRIERRFRSMLAQGLIEEVEKLYGRSDLHPDLPSIRSVGYRQVWAYLAGEYDYQLMTEKAIIATRQLAKRQFTWLRRYRDAQWFDSEDRHLQNAVLTTVQQWRDHGFHPP